MFGEIKGLRPHNSGFVTAFTILFIAEWLGFFGYLDGFLNPDGDFAGGDFQWSQSIVIYTGVLWISFGVILLLLFRVSEDIKVKVGALALSCLPVFIFLAAIIL